MTPCLRCLFVGDDLPGLSPTCDTAGVLGPLVAIIASLQVTEALKIVLGRWSEVRGGLAIIDPWWGVNLPQQNAARRPSPDCPCCAQRRFEHLDGDLGSVSARLCGREAVQVAQIGSAAVDLGMFEQRLAPLAKVRRTPLCLHVDLDEGPGETLRCTLFEDGRLIVRGIHDENRARQLYHRYFSV